MRKNISLHNAIEARAKQLIKARGFSGLSNLIEVLVREEYERRHAPVLASMDLTILSDAPNSSPGHQAAGQVLAAHGEHARGAASAPHHPEKPITYKAGRRSKKKPTP